MPTARGGDTWPERYENAMSLIEQAGYMIKVQWECELSFPTT